MITQCSAEAADDVELTPGSVRGRFTHRFGCDLVEVQEEVQSDEYDDRRCPIGFGFVQHPTQLVFVPGLTGAYRPRGGSQNEGSTIFVVEGCDGQLVEAGMQIIGLSRSSHPRHRIFGLCQCDGKLCTHIPIGQRFDRSSQRLHRPRKVALKQVGLRPQQIDRSRTG